MATFRDKLRAAIETYRYGYGGRPQARKAPPVDAPLIFPDYSTSQAQWRSTDVEAYLNEGYTINSLVYAAVMYKAEASATPALRAYKGSTDEPELLDANHPLAKLCQRPNPNQSWREMQTLSTIFANVTGDSFKLLDRTGSKLGVPSAIYELNPTRTFIIPGPDKKSILGYLYVPYGKSTGQGIPMLPEDVMHVKFPDPSDPLDGLGYGLSRLAASGQSIDVDNMVTEFLNIFFKTGVIPAGILSFDRDMSDPIISRTRERWKEIYGSYKNWSSEIAILERGGKYQQIGMTFRDMGFADLDERNETRILSTLRVPPILISSRAGLLRATYAVYETARRAFWEDTMVSELMLHQDEYQYYLQSDDGGFVAYDLTTIPALQMNIPALVTAWCQLVAQGVPKSTAANTVGLPMEELPDGDVAYMPANLLPIGAVSTDTSDSADLENADEDTRKAGYYELARELKRANDLLETTAGR